MVVNFPFFERGLPRFRPESLVKAGWSRGDTRMRLFIRFMVCWVLALSAGGAFAVSSSFMDGASFEVAAR